MQRSLKHGWRHHLRLFIDYTYALVTALSINQDRVGNGFSTVTDAWYLRDITRKEGRISLFAYYIGP